MNEKKNRHQKKKSANFATLVLIILTSDWSDKENKKNRFFYRAQRLFLVEILFC